MHQLQSIQRQFWDCLRNRDTNAECLPPLSEGGTLSNQERLEIYRNTMRSAHIRALAGMYSCSEKILGERYFRQIATEYYHAYPATSQDLNLYGESFPTFMLDWVHNHPELVDYPYLPDLAKLELAIEQSYRAKDDPDFDFDMLATLDEDGYRNICFTLGASLSILESAYPVYEIWTAHQEQDEVEVIGSIDKPQYLCIARENFKPLIHKVDQASWWVMEKTSSCHTFGELESLAQLEKIDIPLQRIIPELIHKRWICGYKIIARHTES